MSSFHRRVGEKTVCRPEPYAIWACVRGSHGGARCGDVVATQQLGDRRLALVVADLIGNGARRALRAEAFARDLLARLALGASPALALRLADAALQRAGLEEGLPPLVTVFAGVADGSQQILRYVSAAHDTAIVLGQDGDHRHLACTGPVAGIFEAAWFRDVEVRFAAGDALVVATDGITESERADGSFFGTTGIVRAVTHALRVGGDPAAELVAEAVRYVAAGYRDAGALIVRTLREDTLDE